MNNKLLKSICFTVCTTIAVSAYAQGMYYRYVNDEGVKVISSSIPPNAAKNGYEVVNRSGKVIQVVEPAPPPEDVARVKHERAIMERYKILSRRYSNVDELISARERKLSRLSADIAILKNNIDGLNSQIDDLMSKGADAERAGRAVPTAILNNIEQIKAEIANTQSRLDSRLEQEDKVHKDFADDLILFEQGLAIEQAKKGQEFSGNPSLSAP